MPESKLNVPDVNVLSLHRLIAILCLITAETAPNCLAGDRPAVSFNDTVKPFLTKHCVDCHSGDSAKANLNLEKLTADFSGDETANRWIDVMHALRFQEMPPADEPQPDAIEKANLTGWIIQQMVDTNRFGAYQKKQLAPEYGNWVSHEKLFSGEIETPPFSPSRLWRMSPEIFLQKGFGRAKSPYSYLTSERGIRDYAAKSIADQSTIQMMMIVADSFLADRLKRGEFKEFSDDEPTPDGQALRNVVGREFRRVVGRTPRDEEREKYTAFLKRNIDTGGNLEGLKTTIKAMFLSPESVYRMELGLGETDKHGRRQLSSEEVAYSLAFALTDRGPDHNRFIREAKDKGELKTKENVAALVQQLVDEQLTTGHWDRKDLPRIMRFFDEFFGFHRAGAVFKDNDRKRAENIPQWNTDMLIHDARTLILHVLNQDKDVIAELLTTNEYFIAHPGDNEYARERYEERIAELTDPGYVESQVEKRRKQIERDFNFRDMPEKAKRELERARTEAKKLVTMYTTAIENGKHRHPGYPFSNKSRGIADLIYIAPYNLPTNGRNQEQKWDWPIEQPLVMPNKQRAGLLTHPAWLAAHSLNEDNDPIRRGIWIYERLLAGVVGDVPPDVDAVVPTDPHKTLRERMEPLRAEHCWKCHRKINPLGEPFEMFDDWGRYRSHHYVDEDGEIYMRRDGQFDRLRKDGKLTTRKVDATGAIAYSGDAAVDGKVKNAVEMMHRLGNADRARQSFIRHLFRYFMGRNEMLSDSQTLIEAERAYLDNDGSFKALVVSLLSSDSFLYRR